MPTSRQTSDISEMFVELIPVFDTGELYAVLMDRPRQVDLPFDHPIVYFRALYRKATEMILYDNDTDIPNRVTDPDLTAAVIKRVNAYFQIVGGLEAAELMLAAQYLPISFAKAYLMVYNEVEKAFKAAELDRMFAEYQDDSEELILAAVRWWCSQGTQRRVGDKSDPQE